MSGSGIKTFGAYLNSLENLAYNVISSYVAQKRSNSIRPILDGEVAKQFRTRVPLEIRRSAGAFFTGTKLARRLLGHSLSNLPADAIICDPACGVGDLLLAAAWKLPASCDLAKTLQIWGGKLMGFDVHPEFVRAAKVRLLLLAMLRSSGIEDSTIPKLSKLFPMICVHDFLAQPKKLARASHILINPPYNKLIAPYECTWGNMKVSAAVLFMDACLSNASTGAKIAAILPDVLRSGSSYEKWRQHIESLSERMEITTYGQFDKWTDVDVFTVKLLRSDCQKSSKGKWWKSVKGARDGKVGDYFKVHVGPVVPHRDPEKGPCVAYVHAKTLPAWGRVKRINEQRRFNGTLFKPPFVAVRRTSRPGDKRAIATIITGKRKIAAENHLLVLLPKDKTISLCKKLIKILRTAKTDIYLNKRIRCRHLTVSALAEVPWWELSK
ncbi:hypothetical protein ES703_116289 [subsurface metagenome]